MKTAVIVHPDHTVDVILYSEKVAVRKVTIYNDGRVAFIDYDDPRKSKELVVLSKVKR